MDLVGSDRIDLLDLDRAGPVARRFRRLGNNLGTLVRRKFS